MEKPMLAHSWDKYAHKIVYPCMVQPKLDGMRCLATREGDSIRYLSRTLKEVKNVHHLDTELLKIMRDGDTFDGELFIPGVDFQTLISWIKRKQADTHRVEYHVYDMYSDKRFYNRRHSLLCSILDLGLVYNVPTRICDTVEEVEERHSKYMDMGFEGTMIRNTQSLYKYGKRSFDLLKKKDWFDEEYKIVDVVEGKGKFVGCAVLVCTTGTHQFSCTSPGSVQDKQAYWESKEALIGKQVTVKYQEKTNTGVPRFPVALIVRDYE